MKKLLALAAVMSALFTVGPMAPTTAEAGYRSRVVGQCQHCRGNILAYYRPVQRFQSRVVYGWVTAPHTQCQSRFLQSRHFHQSHAQRYVQQRMIQQQLLQQQLLRSRVPFGHSRFVRPGISFHFGSSRGFCR